MNVIVRCLLLTSAMLTAEAALAQDFKSQATDAAQWDSALNSGDAAKVAQAYTKTAVILPAGGEDRLMGSKGPKRFWRLIKGGEEP